MGPIFEDRLVDALRLDEMPALIGGDAGEENVVVRALDDVDGVDLDIAEMFHGKARRLRPVTERRDAVEPLGAQPDASGFGIGEGLGVRRGTGHRAGTIAGVRGPINLAVIPGSGHMFARHDESEARGA